MLRDQLASFLRRIPHIKNDDQKALVRAILLYITGRKKADDFRVLSRTLNITEELYEFKSSYLDRSYYTISQFWRIVWAYYRRLSASGTLIDNLRDSGGLSSTVINESALHLALSDVRTVKESQREVFAADVRLLEDFLTIEDHHKLYLLARCNNGYSTPTDIDLQPIIEKLRRYCWSLAYHKARFISMNDVGIDLDDIAIELFEVGLRTMREFDSEYYNELKLLNTAKVGARHHCSRMIDYHTAQKRSRLVRVGDGEYQTTTISLDHELQDNNRGATILDTIENGEEGSDETLHREQWLVDLVYATSDDISRVIEITLGVDDPEFESWLQDRTGKQSLEISDTMIARYACEFVHVPISAVRDTLRQNEVIANAITTRRQQAALA